MRERAGVESGPRARTSSGLRRCASVRVSEWRGPDLNRRHRDFQSRALPAELPRQRASSIPAGRGPEPADGARELLAELQHLCELLTGKPDPPHAADAAGIVRRALLVAVGTELASLPVAIMMRPIANGWVTLTPTSGGLRSACGRSGCRAARTHAGLIRGHAQRRQRIGASAATRAPRGEPHDVHPTPPDPPYCYSSSSPSPSPRDRRAGAPTNGRDPGQAGGGPGGTGADRAAG